MGVNVFDQQLRDVTVDGDPIRTAITEALPAGDELIGKIAGSFHEVAVPRVVAAAGDYAAEDVISEHATAGTAWVFPIGRVAGGKGYITKAIAAWETTALTPRLTLYLFNEIPTSVKNDNVANTGPALADILSFQGQIDFPALEDLGGMSAAVATPNTASKLPLAYRCGSTANLYGILVTRDAITGEAANSKLAIILGGDQY